MDYCDKCLQNLDVKSANSCGKCLLAEPDVLNADTSTSNGSTTRSV